MAKYPPEFGTRDLSNVSACSLQCLYERFVKVRESAVLDSNFHNQDTQES